MSKTYPASVKISETTLTDHLIDNLAAEHYGIVAAYAGADHPNEITVDFRDLMHLDGEMLSGETCRAAFRRALTSYEIGPDA